MAAFRLLYVHAELMTLPTDAFYLFYPVVRFLDLQISEDYADAFCKLFATF